MSLPSHSLLSQRAERLCDEPVASVLMATTLRQPELVSLAAGFADQATLPVEATRRAMERLEADPALARAALQYGTTIGHPPLRQAVLDRMITADAAWPGRRKPNIENVVVTAGSNQLLFLVCDVLLDPGDIVLCAAPTYYVFLGLLNNLGARAVGVAADEFGVVPEAFEEELARREATDELGRVKALYVTTYYDNPSAVTVPADRRAALVEIARRWSRRQKVYLIEDAAYRELRYEGDDTPSLLSFDAEGDTVVHAGTFSKSFSPGIRVGWGILPPGLLRPVLREKGNIDFGSPNFTQALMTTVVESGEFDEHVKRLRTGYRAKIGSILRAADEFLGPLGGVEWARPTGGLYAWLRLPEGIDTGLGSELFDLAVAEGVLYVPGSPCYPAEGLPRPRNMLRLSFGEPTCDAIRRGVESLARAIRQVL